MCTSCQQLIHQFKLKMFEIMKVVKLQSTRELSLKTTAGKSEIY